MEEYIQVSAKTKNEAITKAAIELGTASDELDIIVVSEGSSGFFGIGSKPAIIKARKKGRRDYRRRIPEGIGERSCGDCKSYSRIEAGKGLKETPGRETCQGEKYQEYS